MSDRVLDSAIIKDLSNHIYEKRKATAFQIELFTKAALSRNDSQTIYKIIHELGDLTNSGTNLAKMGAITALGSVSVALGSMSIAYFLDEIIKPIFATFKDTDARVRYYACESLYNIAKIARGEILVYFNEVYDILLVLVTDLELLVKNAADILDRLIKDIVSAKATNYVLIIYQKEQPTEITSHLVDANGVAIQINHPQDVKKAFSLPKFIPTLLERMRVLDPFCKKFMLLWLELFDDIPSLELISFLPTFLEPLLKFLLNLAPADLRMDTENMLKQFLHEVQAIAHVRHEKRRRERDAHRKQVGSIKAANNDEDAADKLFDLVKLNLTTIIHPTEPDSVEEEEEDVSDDEFVTGEDIYLDYPNMIEILLAFLRHDTGTKIPPVDFSGEPHEVVVNIQQISLTWLQQILAISPLGFVNLVPQFLGIVIKNVASTEHDKDYDLRNQFLEFSEALQQVIVDIRECSDESQLQGITPDLYEKFLESQLQLVINTISESYTATKNDLAKIICLEWMVFLYNQAPTEFLDKMLLGQFKLGDLLKLLLNDVASKVLELFATMNQNNDKLFDQLIRDLLEFFHSQYQSNKPRIEFVVRKVCTYINLSRIYQLFSVQLESWDDKDFVDAMVVTLNQILLTLTEMADLRTRLRGLDMYKLDDWQTFSTLFQSWSHLAPLTLSLCLLTSNYELAYLIIKHISEQEVGYQLLMQLDILVQLIELPIFLKMRMQLLEPEKQPYLYKTLYGLLMILPQLLTYTTLQNRLNLVVGMLTLMGTTVASAAAPALALSSTNQLIRKKRIYELLDKFVLVNSTEQGEKALTASVARE